MQDRNILKTKFDNVAFEYESCRPSYPKSFMNEILRELIIVPNSLLLEIGCGTGKATEFFLKTNAKIHAIDIGDRLIEIARNKYSDYMNISFEKKSFEEFNPKEKELFDFVISAQAFHWIDPEIAYLKLSNVLKKNGKIALFWNVRMSSLDGMQEKLNEIYEQIVPSLNTSYKKRTTFNAFDRAKREVRSCGYFNNVKEIIQPWTKKYASREYVSLLNTFSDHINLSEEKRKSLFQEISGVILKNNDCITVRYEASAILAENVMKG